MPFISFAAEARETTSGQASSHDPAMAAGDGIEIRLQMHLDWHEGRLTVMPPNAKHPVDLVIPPNLLAQYANEVDGAKYLIRRPGGDWLVISAPCHL